MCLKTASLRFLASFVVVAVLVFGIKLCESTKLHKSLVGWKFRSRVPKSSRWVGDNSAEILLLSLADGTLMAVDLESGSPLWSIKEDGLTFVSLSTNHNIYSDFPYVVSSGGDLYKIHEGIAEFVPFDEGGHIYLKDTLYSSISRQDSVLMGVNVKTGELYYYCSSNSCFQNSTDLSSYGNSNNVLLVRRILKTKKIIDMFNGKEFIKFTHGQHEVFPLNTSYGKSPKENSSNEFSTFNGDSLRYDINLNVLYGFGPKSQNEDKLDSGAGCWKLQLFSSLLSVWVSEVSAISHNIQKVELRSLIFNFDREGRPLIDNRPTRRRILEGEGAVVCPLNGTFLNLNGNTPFLHIIDNFKNNVNFNYTEVFSSSGMKFSRLYDSLELSQGPLAAKEIIKILHRRGIERRANSSYNPVNVTNVQSLRLRISFWSLSFKSYSRFFTEIFGNSNVFIQEHILIVPLISLWKEITYAAVLMTVVVFILLKSIRRLKFRKRLDHNLTDAVTNAPLGDPRPVVAPNLDSSIKLKDDNIVSEISSPTSLLPSSLTSRYKTDFQHIGCIGNGGFGVVFKAKNVVNDCLYAVKRVELPDCMSAKEKVMREVKALAKLDHPGIIRFYNAWFEVAPETTDDACTFDENHGCEQSSTTSQCSKNLESCPSSSSPKEVLVHSSLSCEPFPPLKWRKDSGLVSDDDDDEIIIEFENDGGKREEGLLWDDSLQDEEESSSIENTKNNLSQRHTRNDCHVLASCNQSPGLCNHSRRIHLYIQMQLCHKQTLRTWLIKTSTDRDLHKSTSLFHQILCAIEFVHSQGLMHRDLKPSNIFFAFDGAIKIGDFGLVTRIDSPLSPLEKEEEEGSFVLGSDGRIGGSVTYNGNYTRMVGTELYMSPEQLQGRPYDYKIDIYSLGLILFELLVRFGTQMERHKLLTRAKTWCFPQDLRDSRPLDCEILRWMLHTDPSKRPSATEILHSYTSKGPADSKSLQASPFLSTRECKLN